MKIFLIVLYEYRENSGDVQSIVKATTSYEAAREYVLKQIDKHKNSKEVSNFTVGNGEEKYEWEIRYTLTFGDGDQKSFYSVEMTYRIEPIELIDSEDVPEIRRPALEKRCETLEKHNDELKKEVSELRKSNSAAQCYLTFWDGGRYEDLDHVLKDVNIAKVILRGGEQGNNHILELFEGWKKHEK